MLFEGLPLKLDLVLLPIEPGCLVPPDKTHHHSNNKDQRRCEKNDKNPVFMDGGIDLVLIHFSDENPGRTLDGHDDSKDLGSPGSQQLSSTTPSTPRAAIAAGFCC